MAPLTTLPAAGADGVYFPQVPRTGYMAPNAGVGNEYLAVPVVLPEQPLDFAVAQAMNAATANAVAAGSGSSARMFWISPGSMRRFLPARLRSG